MMINQEAYHQCRRQIIELDPDSSTCWVAVLVVDRMTNCIFLKMVMTIIVAHQRNPVHRHPFNSLIAMTTGWISHANGIWHQIAMHVISVEIAIMDRVVLVIPALNRWLITTILQAPLQTDWTCIVDHHHHYSFVRYKIYQYHVHSHAAALSLPLTRVKKLKNPAKRHSHNKSAFYDSPRNTHGTLEWADCQLNVFQDHPFAAIIQCIDKRFIRKILYLDSQKQLNEWLSNWMNLNEWMSEWVKEK